MNSRGSFLLKKQQIASKESFPEMKQASEGFGNDDEQFASTLSSPTKKMRPSTAQMIPINMVINKNNSLTQIHGVLAKPRPLTSNYNKKDEIPFFKRNSKRPSTSSTTSLESVSLANQIHYRDVNKERNHEVHQLTKNLRYTECSAISKKNNKVFRTSMEKMNKREEGDEINEEQSAQTALQKLLRKIENTEFSSLIPKVKITTDFGALFDDLVRLKDMKEVDSDPKTEDQSSGGLNSIEIRKNQSKEFTVSKTSYNYFYVNCYCEKSPLRLIIKQNEEIYEKGMFRGFISTSYDLPTKTNCDRYFEGSSFKFYSPDRKPQFSCQKIFVSIIAGNNEKVRLKAKFGDPEKKVTKESMDLFKRKKDMTFYIHNISEEQLRSALIDIHRRRREEKIKYGIGNHIEKNKYLDKFAFERKSSDIMLRGQIQDFKIKQAKERKQSTQDEVKHKKIFLSQKHEFIKNIKSALDDVRDQKNKVKKRDKVWFDFYCLIQLLEALSTRIREKFRERDRKRNIASMIVNKQLNFKESVKLKGANSKQWILNDVKHGLEFKLPIYFDKINKNAEYIIVDFLKKTIVNFVVHEKCKQFIDQVLKFKNRWKLYKSKRTLLKKNLRFLWEKWYPEMLDRIYGQEMRAQKKSGLESGIPEEKDKDQLKAIKKLVSYKDAQMHTLQKEHMIEETLNKVIQSSKSRFSIFVFKMKEQARKSGKPFRLVDCMKKIPRLNQLENHDQIKLLQNQDRFTKVNNSVDEVRYPILFEMPTEEEFSEKMFQILLKVSKPQKV